MNDQVRIIAEEILSDEWSKLTKVTFDLLRRDGSWQRADREVYDHGDAAAVLLYNKAKSTVILVRQFRFPLAYRGGNAMMIEVCAGLLDGNDPATCAKREAEEETGYRVSEVEYLFDTYMSPGSVTERISLFFAPYDEASRVSDGGGLHEEGEDIEVMEMAFATALGMIRTGEITDGKTIVLLQEAALRGLFA